MGDMELFLEQIREVVQDNGWKDQIRVDQLNSEKRVRLTLSEHHPLAPGAIINDYDPNIHPLEQVQQECLRAIRTGRTGV